MHPRPKTSQRGQSECADWELSSTGRGSPRTGAQQRNSPARITVDPGGAVGTPRPTNRLDFPVGWACRFDPPPAICHPEPVEGSSAAFAFSHRERERSFDILRMTKAVKEGACGPTGLSIIARAVTRTPFAPQINLTRGVGAQITNGVSHCKNARSTELNETPFPEQARRSSTGRCFR